MKPPPDLSLAQIKVYEVIQRNRMAWTTLTVVLTLLTVGFLSFLFAMFLLPQQDVAKGVLGGIDALLGWAVHRIVGNLFPKRAK
jgi:hypothetical protein